MTIPHRFRGAAPRLRLSAQRVARGLASTQRIYSRARRMAKCWTGCEASREGSPLPRRRNGPVTTLLGGEELTENGSPGSWHPLRIAVLSTLCRHRWTQTLRTSPSLTTSWTRTLLRDISAEIIFAIQVRHEFDFSVFQQKISRRLR